MALRYTITGNSSAKMRLQWKRFNAWYDLFFVSKLSTKINFICGSKNAAKEAPTKIKTISFITIYNTPRSQIITLCAVFTFKVVFSIYSFCFLCSF